MSEQMAFKLAFLKASRDYSAESHSFELGWEAAMEYFTDLVGAHDCNLIDYLQDHVK